MHHLSKKKKKKRGTTSLLKFPIVPTRHPDGSAVTNEWLLKTISSHPKWQNVEFVQKPRFIVQASRTIGLTATVFVESPTIALHQ